MDIQVLDLRLNHGLDANRPGNHSPKHQGNVILVFYPGRLCNRMILGDL